MTGKQLLALRKARGWTQAEAAKELCTSAGTYRQWETGRRAISPTVGKLIRIIFKK